MAKFKRADVQAILDPGEEVEFSVTGELVDGTSLEDLDYIRVF